MRLGFISSNATSITPKRFGPRFSLWPLSSPLLNVKISQKEFLIKFCMQRAKCFAFFFNFLVQFSTTASMKHSLKTIFCIFLVFLLTINVLQVIKFLFTLLTLNSH